MQTIRIGSTAFLPVGAAKDSREGNAIETPAAVKKSRRPSMEVFGFFIVADRREKKDAVKGFLSRG